MEMDMTASTEAHGRVAPLGAEPSPPTQALDPTEDAGYRRLAAATLWRAVEDARGTDGQVAYSAIRWLAGDSQDGLTLHGCCELLGIAPSRVQSSLIRHFEPVRIRMERYRKVRQLSTPQKSPVAP